MMRGLDTVLGMRTLGILVVWILLGVGCDSDEASESESEEESVGQDVDPSEDPDSHPADVILSGAMGPMALIERLWPFPTLWKCSTGPNGPRFPAISMPLRHYWGAMMLTRWICIGSTFIQIASRKSYGTFPMVVY